MLTTTTKHALRALVVLAARGGEEALLGRDLAALAKIPANYLSKILVDLGRAGLVDATRGSGGGYRLAVAPDQIPLMRVVEIFEGVRARPDCLLGCEHECSDETPCSAHETWRDIKRAYIRFLEETTLADIASHEGVMEPCNLKAQEGGGTL